MPRISLVGYILIVTVIFLSSYASGLGIEDTFAKNFHFTNAVKKASFNQLDMAYGKSSHSTLQSGSEFAVASIWNKSYTGSQIDFKDVDTKILIENLRGIIVDSLMNRGYEIKSNPWSPRHSFY